LAEADGNGASIAASRCKAALATVGKPDAVFVEAIQNELELAYHGRLS
jgi:hypothetical protein